MQTLIVLIELELSGYTSEYSYFISKISKILF